MGQPTEEDRNRLASQTQPANEEPCQEPAGLQVPEGTALVFLRENGEEVQLAEVINKAVAASGMTGFEWNAASQEKQESWVGMVIETEGLIPIIPEAMNIDESPSDTDATELSEGAMNDETTSDDEFLE